MLQLAARLCLGMLLRCPPSVLVPVVVNVICRLVVIQNPVETMVKNKTVDANVHSSGDTCVYNCAYIWYALL